MDSSDSGTAAAATPFLCMYGCSYPFPRKGERDRHIDEKHHARKKCPHCSFSSPRRQRLKEHLEGKHGIRYNQATQHAVRSKIIADSCFNRSRKVRKVKSVTINSKPRSLRKGKYHRPRIKTTALTWTSYRFNTETSRSLPVEPLVLDHCCLAHLFVANLRPARLPSDTVQ